MQHLTDEEIEAQLEDEMQLGVDRATRGLIIDDTDAELPDFSDEHFADTQRRAAAARRILARLAAEQKRAAS